MIDIDLFTGGRDGPFSGPRTAQESLSPVIGAENGSPTAKEFTNPHPHSSFHSFKVSIIGSVTQRKQLRLRMSTRHQKWPEPALIDNILPTGRMMLEQNQTMVAVFQGRIGDKWTRKPLLG